MRTSARRIALLTAVFLLGGVVAAVPAGAAAEWHITEPTTLTEDYHGGIYIDDHDVTLDCAGFGIYPDGANYQNGISLSGVDRVTVKNCVVDGGAMNIYAEYGTDLHFTGNTLLNAYWWDGLRVQWTDGVLIESNYAEGNARQGFAAWYDTNATWTGNTAVANGIEGFSFGFTADAITTGNTSSGHSEIGFASHGSTGSYYEGNTATQNRTGFGMSAQTDLTLVGNNANRNTNFGFGMHQNTGVTYLNNKASGNGISGFYIAQMDDVELRGNTAIRNAGDGFSIWDSTSVTLDSNVARNNFHGIVMGNGSGHTLINNTITKSELDGVILNGTLNSLVSDNTSNHNGKFGFSASNGAASNTFIHNSARKNGQVDAYDDTGGLNTWTDNDFKTVNFN